MLVKGAPGSFRATQIDQRKLTMYPNLFHAVLIVIYVLKLIQIMISMFGFIYVTYMSEKKPIAL